MVVALTDVIHRISGCFRAGYEMCAAEPNKGRSSQSSIVSVHVVCTAAGNYGIIAAFSIWEIYS